MKKDWNPFDISQWVAWLSATMLAAIIGTSYLHTTFAKSSTIHELKNDIQTTLVRIETKIDKLHDARR